MGEHEHTHTRTQVLRYIEIKTRKDDCNFCCILILTDKIKIYNKLIFCFFLSFASFHLNKKIPIALLFFTVVFISLSHSRDLTLFLIK